MTAFRTASLLLSILLAPIAQADPKETTATTPPLEGTKWVLELMEEKKDGKTQKTKPIVSPMVTLDFADGNATGMSTVNSYGCPVKVDPKKGSILFDGIIGGLRFGEETAMKQEKTYLRLLATMTTYKVEKEKLILSNKEGSAKLRFIAFADRGIRIGPIP